MVPDGGRYIRKYTERFVPSSYDNKKCTKLEIVTSLNRKIRQYKGHNICYETITGFLVITKIYLTFSS